MLSSELKKLKNQLENGKDIKVDQIKLLDELKKLERDDEKRKIIKTSIIIPPDEYTGSRIIPPDKYTGKDGDPIK